MSTNDFTHKTIVVTGAASGIGQRTAQMLIDAGAQIIALDRNPPDCAVRRFVPVDLSKPASIDAAVAAIGDTPIHGLCNIAGVPGTLPDEVVARVNYLGLRYLTKSLLPRLARGSAIVHLASMAGFKWREHADKYVELALLPTWQECERWIAAHPFLKEETYRRFKEALIVWCQTFGGEWQKKHGVRMNCVSPGPVDTPILDDFKASLGQKNVADLIGLTGRPGTPDDIAPVVLFLLSDASRWIVGADIPTDGGMGSSRFAAAYQTTAEA